MQCTVQELKSKRDRGENPVVLDVRTDEELEIVSLPNVVHIPLHELMARVGELEPHKGGEIICMCHHGGRSAQAQHFLLSKGFSNVLNLSGGIHTYAVQVDDSLATY